MARTPGRRRAVAQAASPEWSDATSSLTEGFFERQECRRSQPESYPRTRTWVKRAAASVGRPSAIGLTGDVTSSRDDVARAVAATLEEFGRLDILVNNAGIAPMHPSLETTTELFDRVMAVNVRGSFLAALACAREMARRGRGCLVQIASICAFTSGASLSLSVYNMSKAAVRQMVATLVRWLVGMLGRGDGDCGHPFTVRIPPLTALS